MIYVIDDDVVMRECIMRACSLAYENIAKRARGKIPDNGGGVVQGFADGIHAMEAIGGGEVPELIFLDVLLDGPDGFTFLNELVSYVDTARIPVVMVSSLDFTGKDLAMYGVVGVLLKEEMRPEDIGGYVERYVGMGGVNGCAE